MGSQIEGVEELFDFVVSFEDEGMEEVCVLWSFEDDVSEVGEKGIEAGFHVPDHLNFPGQLVSEKVFDGLVGSGCLFCQ